MLLLLACTPAPVDPAPVDPAPQVAPAAEGPRLPPPPGHGPPHGSGAALQDPSGFPMFHDRPAPGGTPITGLGDWSSPVLLSDGGYRPQVDAARDGALHAIFYTREEAGDLIQHRVSRDQGATWSEPVRLGFDTLRNWGPDVVSRDDGSVVVCFDHAQPDLTSRGWLTVWDGTDWSDPAPLTADDPQGEIGSGHIAHGVGDALSYVWIGKQLGPENRFRAWTRSFDGATWSEPVALSDGSQDAWHTNIERRPDGSMLLGFDIGTGGKETALHVAEIRDGVVGALENLSESGPSGERPHFAFGDVDHVTWFRKVAGNPVHIYVRSGGPGAWGPEQHLSQGYGGYHFDPEIAIGPDGTRVVVWGWDAGTDAELVYAVDQGQGWSAPRKVAELDHGKPGLPSLVADDAGRFHVVWNQGVRGESRVYHATLELP